MLSLHPLTAIDRAELGHGPTDAELDAIEQESPVILAEVELLDVQIATLDRPLSDLDARRLRRAAARVLAARRDLANRGTSGSPVVA
ncbi:DUF6284 family protein [Streptomyces olivoreticuli]